MPYPRAGEPDSVVRLLDEQGASHGVLFPHDRVMTPPWDADYDHANGQVGEAVRAHPDRIVGLARINPTFGAAHTRNIREVGIDRITYGSDVPYQSTAVGQRRRPHVGVRRAKPGRRSRAPPAPAS